ncbi:hypothetical protein EK904_007155, partial [Melospiza melodia maxima]
MGFEITIDHPHTHVVKCTQLVRASKDLAQTSYFMATNRKSPKLPPHKTCWREAEPQTPCLKTSPNQAVLEQDGAACAPGSFWGAPEGRNPPKIPRGSAAQALHLTTFSLQYTPPVVACVCIHLACKWSNWEIPVSTDGKHWWEYVDGTVTLELLDELTHEFLQILEKTPSRLKRIRNWR